MPFIQPTKFTRLEALLESKARALLVHILKHGRKEALDDLIECCQNILEPRWEYVEDVWGDDMEKWSGANPDRLCDHLYEQFYDDLPFDFDFLKENIISDEGKFMIYNTDPLLYRIGFFFDDLLNQEYIGEHTTDDAAENAFRNATGLTDLLKIWDHFYWGSKRLTPEMYQKLLLDIEGDIILLAGLAHQHQRSGGKSMREKSEKRQQKILKKAFAVDLHKSMTAYELTQEIGPEFDSHTKVRTNKFSTTSKPKRKAGFGDTSIRNTLKSNGWK